MLDFAQARRMMVDCQLRTFDVTDKAVLAAFDEVPRERFVAPGHESLAYSDQDLPVSETAGRRYMLNPMVAGRMVQALEIEPGQKALDVACGLGYTSAVLARLGASVVAFEESDDAANAARRRLAECGVDGVTVAAGSLNQGYPDGAPYSAILVNGAVERKPAALLDQLADGGRLVCVEGRGRAAKAMLYVRSGDAFGLRPLFDAAAPLLPAFRTEPGFVF